MPAPGAVSMDWFKAQESSDKQPPPSTPEPASLLSGVPLSDNPTPSISNQDVDSMFAVEMPDWLSQKPEEPANLLTGNCVICVRWRFTFPGGFALMGASHAPGGSCH